MELLFLFLAGIFTVTSATMCPSPSDSETVKPRSCVHIRQIDPAALDCHYVLYPDSLGGKPTTFYCHNMATSPTEYVSLAVANSGSYPNIGNLNCKGEGKTPKPERSGNSTFSKIRVDVSTMTVDRTDYTFAVTTGKPVPYGEASDCYSIHYGGNKAPCGIKGNFVIDTTDTPFVVDPTLTWSATGWNPFAEISKSTDGRVISLLCGGWCGGCEPDKPMKLVLAQP